MAKNEKVNPELVSVDAVAEAISEYKRQYQVVERQLLDLEQSYQKQRELAINTLNQLHGAVQALELLKQPGEKKSE